MAALPSWKVLAQDKKGNPHEIDVMSNNIHGAVLTAMSVLQSRGVAGPRVAGVQLIVEGPT